ncbi:MAG: hypothetical protein AAGB29_04175 [Planctomycetota bacterium]
MTRAGRRAAWVWGGVWGLMGVVLLGGWQTMTEGERAELIEATPVRFAHWDNPALYAFWSDRARMPRVLEGHAPGEQAGWAPEVSWQALLAAPDAARGDALTVTGRFLASETVSLARSGWLLDGRVQQWVVQWGESDDDVAVVILPALVGVEGTRETQERRVPLRFALVAIPGRFLGMWETLDRDGQPFAFPVFVATDAAVYDGSEHAPGSSGQAALLAGVAVLAAIGAVVWWRVKRSGWESRNHRRREALRGAADPDELDDDVLDEGLANDPAEALGRLTHRD